jgi:uncharacterized protein (PEP-CTERM system associated)
LPQVPPYALTPGSGNVYRYKDGQAVFTSAFTRNTFSLIAFWNEQSQIIVPGQPTASTPDVTQFGASLAWQYKIGSRTDNYLTASAERRSFGNNKSDHFIVLRDVLQYKLGSRTNAQFSVSRVDQQSSYVEHQVGIGINRKIL